MPRPKSIRAAYAVAVAVVVLLAAACGAEAPNPYDEEDAPTGTVAEALSSFDCNPFNDTGYQNGQPFPILLVMVDGKPTEVGTANAYYAMAVAAEASGVALGVTSGFRTMAEQQYLYNCYINCNCNNCNLAASPGYSNHQSGHALDLNWSGGGYEWLTANAAAFGFKRTVPSESWHWEWWGGGPGGGICAACSQEQKDGCGQYGCNCAAGECSGGFCPGTGCSEKEISDCGGFGCNCVDHQCSGGFCPGSGCTAKEELDCGGFGCDCVDHACSGGFCPNSGCTAKETLDCEATGCSCVDHVCSGSACEGTGCTAKETTDCASQECGCVDHECAGGACEGTGCTAKEEADCMEQRCECSEHTCSGGDCADASAGPPGGQGTAATGSPGNGEQAANGAPVLESSDAEGSCRTAAAGGGAGSLRALATFAALAAIGAARRRKRHLVGLLAASLTAGCALGADSDPSEEGVRTTEEPVQHTNANAHQWWTMPFASAWNVDQKVHVETIANASYFATTVFFENVDTGAYMGFQQLGDGTRLARFSVWDAKEYTAGANAECHPFGGEGIGYTCELPFKFDTHRWYTYRMWRLSRDGSGTWWGAWIIDDGGGEYAIGSIKAPPLAGDIAAVDSFDEYWGDAHPCNAVPGSRVWFLAPSLDAGQAYAGFGSTSVGSCSGGRVTPTIYGTSLLELGAY